MARTTRTPLPARRGAWDPDFVKTMERGLVSLSKRDHSNFQGDEVWGQHGKARAKTLRNRRSRRTTRIATRIGERE